MHLINLPVLIYDVCTVLPISAAELVERICCLVLDLVH